MLNWPMSSPQMTRMLGFLAGAWAQPRPRGQRAQQQRDQRRERRMVRSWRCAFLEEMVSVRVAAGTLGRARWRNVRSDRTLAHRPPGQRPCPLVQGRGRGFAAAPDRRRSALPAISSFNGAAPACCRGRVCRGSARHPGAAAASRTPRLVVGRDRHRQAPAGRAGASRSHEFQAGHRPADGCPPPGSRPRRPARSSSRPWALS